LNFQGGSESGGNILPSNTWRRKGLSTYPNSERKERGKKIKKSFPSIKEKEEEQRIF